MSEKELERLKGIVEGKINALGVSAAEANRVAGGIMYEVELSLSSGRLSGPDGW